MRRTPLIPVAAAALALLSTTFAAPATAVPDDTAVDGLITPLSLAVAQNGTVYVSQNFAGMLTKAAPGQDPEVVYTAAENNEVGAVSVDGDVVTFATTFMGSPQDARLYTLGEGGAATEVANLWAYEKAENPDGRRTYGIAGLKKACKDRFGKDQKWLLPYKGIKESHPYASTTVDGTTYVADAAANAILAVSGGTVSTLAVLPPTKVTVTKKIRNALELPKCAKGKTYRLEPVPTDVEAGPDGNLYVTSLPGGPEIPEMGANGAVYQVSPALGAVARVTDGLVSPTGLAISPTGTAYVSMLFASLIMQQPFGAEASPLDEVAFPGDVEYANGKVYATVTDLMSDGSQPPAGQVVSWNVGG